MVRGLALRRGVGEVGDGALGELLVLGVERQPPGELARAARGALDLGGEGVVVRDQPGVGGAERDDHGAGQGGQVDDPVGAELDRVGEGVGEDQPALGVGVVHLDRLAVELGDDVAGLDRGAAGHVLGGGDDREDVDRQLELGDRGDGLEHRGCPGHVHLHLLHPGGRLDRDAAGVEGDALADQPEGLAIAAAPGSGGRSAAAPRRSPARRRRGRPCPSRRSACGPSPRRSRRRAPPRSPGRGRPGRRG